VMDAVGSRRAALLANGPEAGPMALFFAGTRPERTSALILADATARHLVADDQRFRRWSARLQRAIASPRMVRTHLRAMLEVDLRPLLPLIQVPTLVLHHRDFPLVPAAHGRYLAEHIPGARLVELQGDLPLWWDQQDQVLGVVEEFLVGARRSLEPTRVLATVLFTDIVGSRTVRDLVAGSGVVLQDRGSQRLRGVEDEWELFEVVSR
jgi:pimeloyl-ACP methyl ester carboxylesterase